MARPRRLVISVGLLGVVAMAYQGCGMSSDDPVPSAGGAGASVAGAPAHAGRAGSAHAGSSAHAGHAGSSAGSLSAGSDAIGGSGAGGDDTHPGGSDSVWTSTHLFPDVDVQRLEQPQNHTLFSWKACDWTDDPACEETVLDGFVAPTDLSSLIVQVHDDGQSVHVGATLTRLDVAAVTDQEGHVVQAHRVAYGDFLLSALNVHGSRFALPIFHHSPAPYGSLMGMAGGEVTGTLTPKAPVTLLSSGLNWYVLGSERWAWWAIGGAMLSFEASSPTVATVFSSTTSTGTVANVNGLQPMNDRFVSVEYRTDSGRWKPTLVVSDGLTPAQLLFAPDPAIDDACPIPADTHIAWLRGFEFQSTSLYKHVELWASPLSPQGTLTAPAKVMDLDYPSTARGPSDQIGGWGRVLFYDAHDNGTNHPDFRFHIVDLLHPESSIHLAFPASWGTFTAVGMTRTHAWFTLEKGNQPTQRVRRWKLPPGGSSPGG